MHVSQKYFFRREAEIIFHIAKEEKVTGKGHIWIVSQSIVGDLDKETTAPKEFPIGLLGKYFTNNLYLHLLYYLNRPKCKKYKFV